MSINNCATCDYSKYEHEGLHCYMFRTEPEGVCMQHTGRRIKIAPAGATLAAVMAALADMHAAEAAASPLSHPLKRDK